MIDTVQTAFIDSWRRVKSAAFDLAGNSTGGGTIELDFDGHRAQVYNNANLSIYSGQRCNARCPFCVEELRPASRGAALDSQKEVEKDDRRYFAALEKVLETVRPLNPTLSVTGGEPSKDPRLPATLRLLRNYPGRRRTLTTNGSGLPDLREGRRVIDWIVDAGIEHLNISIAHPDPARNAHLMSFREGLNDVALREMADIAQKGGTRVRLSCVLVRDGIHDLEGVRAYLNFARAAGVSNVIFRQLMKSDPLRHAENFVVKYSDRARVRLESLLDRISGDGQFEFRRQIMGYYYYVEVWKYQDMDIVFEEADLAQLEFTKRAMPGIVHELVFHPNGALASTWQPWDGVLLAPPQI